MENAINEYGTNAVESAEKIYEIPIDEIYMDHHFNCRGHLRPIDCEDLVLDIQKNGQLQAGIVTPYHVDHMSKKRWRLIAGHRRFYACKMAKLEFFKATIDARCQDESFARLINLSENLKRKDLNIMQEAKAIAALMKTGFDRKSLAEAVGKSPNWITQRSMLTEFPQDIQNEFEMGMLKTTELQDLYSIFKNQSEDELYAAVRKVKDARLEGNSRVFLNPKKKKARPKKNRNRGEILRMMETLRCRIGNGLHTRVLAWCIGEISDSDLAQDVTRFAEESIDDAIINKYRRSIERYGDNILEPGVIEDEDEDE